MELWYLARRGTFVNLEHVTSIEDYDDRLLLVCVRGFALGDDAGATAVDIIEVEGEDASEMRRYLYGRLSADQREKLLGVRP